MLSITFGPQDVLKPQILLLEIVWFAVAGAIFAAAFRSKTEWGKAGLASLSISLLGWHLMGIIPSWWLNFAEKHAWRGQGCVSLSTSKDASACLKSVGADVVAVAWLGAAFTGFLMAFLLYQKKFPKQLAPGESKPEATGGYK